MPDIQSNIAARPSASASLTPADAPRRPPIPMEDLLSLPICPHLGSTFGAFAPRRKAPVSKPNQASGVVA